MIKIPNLARNTSYLTLALIGQKIITFAYFALLARHFGPEFLGKYYLAISVTTIFAIFIDLGFINFLTRETAKTPDKTEHLLGNVLSLKIVLSFLAIILVLVFANISGYDYLTRTLIYIALISMVLDSFSTTFLGVIRGFHNLKYESITAIIFQLIVLGVGGLGIYQHWPITLIMGALALASIYNFVYTWLIIKKKFNLKLHLVFNPESARLIFVSSWPFAVFAICQRIYTYLDSVLLSLFAGDYYVGLYQVAFKIIFALQFLPMAFIASLYPAMSSYWVSNRPQLKIAFERAMNYLSIISWPLVAGTLVLADQIVLIFKSGYSEAIWPLRITILALFFIFWNFPIGSMLNACDKQKQNTRNMIIVTIISVILNLILIPYYRVIGAAITVLITNALMFGLGIYQIRKIFTYHPHKNLIVWLKSGLAALFMAWVIIFLKDSTPTLTLIVLGAIIYFIMIFILGGFQKADLLYIFKSFGKKSNSEPKIENNVQ